MGKRNFQSDAVKQGAEFEAVCCRALEMCGWDIIERHFKFDDVGIDVDIIATNEHGISFTFSCTGSWNSDRPGLQRTDTIKKKVADAYLQTLSQQANMFPPVAILASHLPESGSGLQMLKTVPRSTILDVLRPEDTKRLRKFCQMTEEDIMKFIRN